MSDLPTVRDWLRDARSVAVLTGAGISAESGVPVFRGTDGLWRQRRAETLASPEAFARDPKFVWEWYDWRRARILEAEPNPGHIALAAFERACRRFTLITQNVDGLHDRAGSRHPLKLHGDIWRLRCATCGHEEDNYDVPLQPLPPYCACAALLRPGVVWFGEALPQDVLHGAAQAAAEADVFLVAGTSAVVHPAASLPILCKQRGGRVVEVNLEATPLTPYADASLQGPTGTILPELLDGVLVR